MSLMPVIGIELVMAVILISFGLKVFSASENYAKRAGLLKRNG